MTPSEAATAQPSRPRRSTRTSSAVEVVAGGPETAARKLLVLARLERRPHGAELLAELRAEHREVRSHVELARLDRPELHVADA